MDAPARHYPLWRYCTAALLSIGLVAGLNALSLRIRPEDAREARIVASGLERLEKGDVQAVNIGGSTARSLDFTELEMTSVDFSFGARDLLENEALLEVVIKHAHGLRYVFLNADPLSMLIDNAWSYRQRRRQYYRILASDRGWRPIGDDWSNLIQGRLLPLVREDRWRGPVLVGLSLLTGDPSWARPPALPGLAAEPPADTAYDPTRLEARKGSIMSVLSGIDRSRYFEHRTPERVKESLIRFCRTVSAHDLELVIYSTPVTDIFIRDTDRYAAEAKPYWDDAITQCRATGATLLRLDTDPAFHHDYRLFDDPLHLNATGDAAFSHKLAGLLDRGERTSRSLR